ncbi:MAG: hypothetical protein AB7F22_35815 [Reyranella sp.]|uniref:hypothetical protein n=1 Tax=Reyranella sp. TaxID=1929291 RepID=UPI003D13D641
MTLWSDIEEIPGARTVDTPGYGKAVLLPVPKLSPSTHWMIGRYKDQTRLATALRTAPSAQAFLAKCHVRLGFRDTDVPPIDLERQESYGDTVKGKNAATDFSDQRVRELTAPARPANAEMTNRISDRRENVRTFWESQTPQSHHVVEFNHLEGIGKSKPTGDRELDHAQLPCVLLAAEFHQRYVSSILKRTHGWSRQQLLKNMPDTYFSIYIVGGRMEGTKGEEPLSPLWHVSRVILRAAGLPVT